MDQVPEAVKDERLYRLQHDITARQNAFLKKQQGITFDVLFEKTGRHAGQIVGRSPYLQPVQVMAPTSLIGEVAAVRITEVGSNSLFGELASLPPPERGRSKREALRVGVPGGIDPHPNPPPFRGRESDADPLRTSSLSSTIDAGA